MVRGWLIGLVFVACVAVGHVAVIAAYPHVAMSIAMAKLSDGGKHVNAWFFGPRTTEASRAIVRPSPDLAYASCVYDLTKGPVEIRVFDWEDYYSLSLYAANTDNFFVRNDRAIGPEGLAIVLARPTDKMLFAPNAQIVRAPSDKGIALLRLLAPDEASFERADKVRREATCGTMKSFPESSSG